MNSNEMVEVLKKIKSSNDYQELFGKVNGIIDTLDNLLICLFVIIIVKYLGKFGIFMRKNVEAEKEEG